MRLDFDERHRLQECGAHAGLETGGAKLLLDVGERFCFTWRAGCASFEFVRGKSLDVASVGGLRKGRCSRGRDGGGFGLIGFGRRSLHVRRAGARDEHGDEGGAAETGKPGDEGMHHRSLPNSPERVRCRRTYAAFASPATGTGMRIR